MLCIWEFWDLTKRYDGSSKLYNVESPQFLKQGLELELGFCSKLYNAKRKFSWFDFRMCNGQGGYGVVVVVTISGRRRRCLWPVVAVSKGVGFGILHFYCYFFCFWLIFYCNNSEVIILTLLNLVKIIFLSQRSNWWRGL